MVQEKRRLVLAVCLAVGLGVADACAHARAAEQGTPSLQSQQEMAQALDALKKDVGFVYLQVLEAQKMFARALYLATEVDNIERLEARIKLNGMSGRDIERMATSIERKDNRILTQLDILEHVTEKQKEDLSVALLAYHRALDEAGALTERASHISRELAQNQIAATNSFVRRNYPYVLAFIPQMIRMNVEAIANGQRYTRNCERLGVKTQFDVVFHHLDKPDPFDFSPWWFMR